MENLEVGLTLTIFLIFATVTVQDQLFAQEKNVFLTGYFSFNGEYIHNLPTFETLYEKKGVGINEASLLTTIKPIDKLKIQTVITYKPRLNWSRIIVEFYGDYTFVDQFAGKIGRFLLPINPVNLQYYAPMNVGITLPLFISNHTLFPLNIDGINLHGRLISADNISMGYSLIAGHYDLINRNKQGVLGFFGRDGLFLSKDTKIIASQIKKFDAINNADYMRCKGGASRLEFNIFDIVDLGLNCFLGFEESNTTIKKILYTTDIVNFNYGMDLTIKTHGLFIKSSFWGGAQTPEDEKHFEKITFFTPYVEMGYAIKDKFSPYAKYEYVDGRTKQFSRFTAGVSYRPFFQTMIKLEYLTYIQEYVDNPHIFTMSTVFSF